VASDLTGDETTPFSTPKPPAATATPAPPEKPEKHERFYPFRGRFIFVYVALAAALGAAIAGLVMAVGGTKIGSTSEKWSSWEPTGGATARAKQITDHVTKAYRLRTGEQLLDVFAKAPRVQDVPIRGIVAQATGNGADEVATVDDENSLMFVLCGGGPSCSIDKGAASLERCRLVRREALELALYTFKYVNRVRYIIAFMPPKKGAQPEFVAFFHRDDFSPQLDRPLKETLATKTPRQHQITPREGVMIDKLTDPHIYKFQLQQAQQGDAILVLSSSV
jgi:hypothetical protein